MKQRSSTCLHHLVTILGATLVTILAAKAAAVTGPSFGNLLIGVDRDLKEYTPDGQFVQSFTPSAHPNGSAEVYDSVYDSTGRIHVLTTSYLATLSADLQTWTYTFYGANGFIASAYDLSLLGNQAYTSKHRFDLNPLTASTLSLPGGDWGELKVGPDGLIYAINTGNPRYRMRSVDPSDLSLEGEIELRDGNNARLTVGSLAFLADGSFYAASENSVFRFSNAGQYLDGITLPTSWLYDLELLHDGSLVAGGRFGELIFLDAALDSYEVDLVGSSQVYIGVVPEPSVLMLTLPLPLLLLRRSRPSKP